MSIYDLPLETPEEPKPPKSQAAPVAPRVQAESPRAEPSPPKEPVYGRSADETEEDAVEKKRSGRRAKRRRFGCGGCLLGCFGMLLVLLIMVGIGGLVVWSQWPHWTRTAVVSAIEDSDLSADDKQQLITQIDRLVNGYREGEITIEEVVAVAEETAKTPLFALMLADAACQKFVKPSGLSASEKEHAELTMHRVARGVYERRIDRAELERPLDFISDSDSNGRRRLRASVSDQDLRTMVNECKQLADSAGIPLRRLSLDVGDEFERAVDAALSDNS